MPEITVDQLPKLWADFRKTNDEILASKAEGKSVGELETKLAKLEKDIGTVASNADRMAQIETALKRIGNLDTKGGDAGDTKHRDAVCSYLRKGAITGDLETKGLAVNSDPDGGYLVHSDLTGRIIKRIFETSPIRAFASVQVISTDSLDGVIDADESDAGWVGETAARNETSAGKLGTWKIPTHEIFAKPRATQKLLDDAAWNVEEWIAKKVADKFARKENSAFVSGDGIGKPRGYLSETTIEDSAAGGDFINARRIGFVKTGAAAGFAPVPASGSDPAQGDALIQLVYALESHFRAMPGTCFAMNRTVLGSVRRLRDNLGNYLWQPGIGAGTPSTLLGFPVAEFADMPSLGANAFPIVFGNFGEAYQIVDRIGIRVLRDPFTAKPHVEFYTTKRVGGATVNHAAIKLLKCAA